MALGLLLIVSWHARFTAILRPDPADAPVPYNVALLFVLCGGALAGAVFGRQTVVRGLAAIAGSLALLTLVQDLTGNANGIDTLFIDPYIANGMSAPGRMSPYSAIAFCLATFGMGLASIGRWRLREQALVAMAGSAVAAIALVALCGHLAGIEQVYGWDEQSHVSWQAALGLGALGAGLVAVAWGNTPRAGSRLPRWLFAPVSISLVAVTVMSALALLQNEHDAVQRLTETQTAGFAREARSEIEANAAVIDRAARRWAANGAPEQATWQHNMALNFETFPAYQAIIWADAGGRARWIAPASDDVVEVGYDYTTDTVLAQTMFAAAARDGIAISPPVDRGRGGLEVYVFRPIVRDGVSEGYIIGVYRAGELFNVILNADVSPDYAVSVSSGGETLFDRSGGNARYRSRFGSSAALDIEGLALELRAWPLALDGQLTLLPGITLVIGLLLSLAAGTMVYLAQAAAARARELAVSNAGLEREIAERMRAQVELLDSEARFRAASEGSLDSFYILRAVRDPAGRLVDFIFVEVNQRAEQTLGRPREQLVGRRAFDLYPEQRANGWFERYIQVIDSRQPLEEDFELTAGTNQSSWVHHQVVPLDDGVAATWRDITDRKRAADELRASSEELARKNRELQEFVYIASHDLKAPLVSLRGMAAMLLEDYGDRLDGDGALYLQRIVANAKKMHTLLDELLTLARVAQSKEERVPVDLNRVVAGVLDQLEHAIAERDARFIVGELPVVLANPAWMTQVFNNLIDNALKYTPPERPPRIEVDAVARDGFWECRVCDNGAGIPEQYHDKVFAMFQRLPTGKALNPEGTGMGLAIVARIVETLGGRCGIESVEGSGTTITLTLPMTAGAGQRTAAPLAIAAG